MKRFALVLLALALSIPLIGCTENMVARRFGGKLKVELKENERLVNVTWKGNADSLWILTKPNTNNTPPTVYTFEEKSQFGMMEGKVIIIEQ